MFYFVENLSHTLPQFQEQGCSSVRICLKIFTWAKERLLVHIHLYLESTTD